jgi:hypothetical protein
MRFTLIILIFQDINKHLTNFAEILTFFFPRCIKIRNKKYEIEDEERACPFTTGRRGIGAESPSYGKRRRIGVGRFLLHR